MIVDNYGFTLQTARDALKAIEKSGIKSLDTAAFHEGRRLAAYFESDCVMSYIDPYYAPSFGYLVRSGPEGETDEQRLERVIEVLKSIVYEGLPT